MSLHRSAWSTFYVQYTRPRFTFDEREGNKTIYVLIFEFSTVRASKKFQKLRRNSTQETPPYSIFPLSNFLQPVSSSNKSIPGFPKPKDRSPPSFVAKEREPVARNRARNTNGAWSSLGIRWILDQRYKRSCPERNRGSHFIFHSAWSNK